MGNGGLEASKRHGVQALYFAFLFAFGNDWACGAQRIGQITSVTTVPVTFIP